MSNEKTINVKCSKCNNYEQIVYVRNEQCFEKDIMTIDSLAFSFEHDRKTVLKMLEILYKCYQNDVKEMKQQFKRLTRNEYEELLDEKRLYFKNTKINSEMIDDLDFYICANLKFIDDAFYFKRCSKCNNLLNAVAVYSV